MPNLCENVVKVKGPKADMVEFIEAVRDGEQILSFEKAVPIPKELKTDVSVNAFCYDNWGTRSDADGLDICPNTVEELVDLWNKGHEFLTAWSPPQQILEELSDAYPALTFIHGYKEELSGFAGLDTYTYGGLFKCVDYNIEDEEAISTTFRHAGISFS